MIDFEQDEINQYLESQGFKPLPKTRYALNDSSKERLCQSAVSLCEYIFRHCKEQAENKKILINNLLSVWVYLGERVKKICQNEDSDC